MKKKSLFCGWMEKYDNNLKSRYNDKPQRFGWLDLNVSVRKLWQQSSKNFDIQLKSLLGYVRICVFLFCTNMMRARWFTLIAASIVDIVKWSNMIIVPVSPCLLIHSFNEYTIDIFIKGFCIDHTKFNFGYVGWNSGSC